MSRSGVFAIVSVAVLAQYILRTLIQAGYFHPKTLNHSPGPCKVFDVDGAEDVEILENGLAFFSSGTKYYSSLNCDSRILARKGRIYLLNMNEPNSIPNELELKSFNNTGFNPHGISLYKDDRTGVVSVFVVNHGPDTQAIEIFDFDEKSKSLVLRRSVVDEKIYSPNDVVAIGSDSFYITNDRFFHFDRVFLRLIEVSFFSFFLKSGVVYFDGKTSHDVVGGMVAPNGIAHSRDGRFIFVSGGFNPYIYAYRRDKNGMLNLVQSFHIGTMVDNIGVDDETGDLWFAAIPKGIDFVAFNENIDRKSPSQIVHLKLGEENRKAEKPFPGFELREVYMNDGSELKAATGTDIYGSKIAVAGIFDKLMICELRYY